MFVKDVIDISNNNMLRVKLSNGNIYMITTDVEIKGLDLPKEMYGKTVKYGIDK